MPLISVVSPVYKAEDCLHELYKRLAASLSEVTDDFEIILIEDCGGDRSWQIIEELSSLDKRVKGIKFARNFGQHYGISAGLDYASGDWTVIIDCDLQEPPEAIPALYNKALEGYEVVLALRNERKDPWHKRLSAYVFYSLFNYLSGMNHDPRVGNLCIVSRRAADTVRQMRETLRNFNGLIAWMGYPTAKIEVTHSERFSGESSYTFSKQLRLASELVIAYSDKPLKITVGLGALISVAAFVGGIYYLVRTLIYGQSIPGWATLIVSIYFLCGIIIFILGIIGIYLGKVFDETKRRPLYLVAKTTNNISDR
jgi:polyisoprenyl-phosphate glycosyltransferase